MIKLRKGNLMVIGLSDENMRRIKENQLVKFNMKVLGFPDIEVYIFNGKDEQTMAKMFKDQIDPTKTVIIDDNAPNN